MAHMTKGIQFQLLFNDTNTESVAFNAMLGDAANADSNVIDLKGTASEEHIFVLAGLQEIGELGLSASGSNGYDQIEITTLADSKHVYIDGLEADGDNAENELTLKYLYNDKVFGYFNDLKDEEAEEDRVDHFYVKLPTGGFNIQGKFNKVALDSVAVNAALTMTITLSVKDIDFSAIPAFPQA